jgi:hypothetical protein
MAFFNKALIYVELKYTNMEKHDYALVKELNAF